MSLNGTPAPAEPASYKSAWIFLIVVVLMMGLIAGVITVFQQINKNEILSNGITATAVSSGQYEMENQYVRRGPDIENYYVLYTFRATDGKTYTVRGRSYPDYGQLRIDILLDKLDGEELQVTYLEDEPDRAIVQDEDWG